MNGLLKKMKYLRWVKEAKDLVINQNYELIWAENWRSTIQGIDWLEKLPSLSPGRWAVGYNYIYVMTRILNEIRPTKVLDMGLGISSTLISHYFQMTSTNDDAYHLIVEHDKEWIDFYQKNRELSEYSKVYNVELEVKAYMGMKLYSYKGLDEILTNKKFSVISIDGPFGSEKYSRTDIIPFLPQILEEDFVIIMDDTERLGEQQTLNKIVDILENHGIKVWTGTYQSLKKCTVIVSQRYRFICSM